MAPNVEAGFSPLVQSPEHWSAAMAWLGFATAGAIIERTLEAGVCAKRPESVGGSVTNICLGEACYKVWRLLFHILL